MVAVVVVVVLTWSAVHSVVDLAPVVRPVEDPETRWADAPFSDAWSNRS